MFNNADINSLGTVGLIWSILWILIIYESPEDHPSITAEEIKLINASVGQEVRKLNAFSRICFD